MMEKSISSPVILLPSSLLRNSAGEQSEVSCLTQCSFIPGQKKSNGATEDEMVGWHHRLSEHEFE